MFLFLRKSSQKLYYILFVCLIIIIETLAYSLTPVQVFGQNNASSVGSLYAGYAALVDGETNRLLYGKNADIRVPMASTTKIMTCIIALEYAPLSLECSTSSYAASMPEVKLYASAGETFVLKDLLYSLMLKSHNDTAVIIAENVASYYLNETGDDKTYSSEELVGIFTGLMNQKAAQLGCTDTYYITPNGLDKTYGDKIHSTTAYELAVVMAYCIGNDTFLQITQTEEYSFSSNLKKYQVANANTFMDMYPDIISGKTGFTALAGYCYVCAYRDENRTLIAVVLASGWPYNKSYRWSDTKKLLDYGRNNYMNFCVLDKASVLDEIEYRYGFETSVLTPYLDTDENIECLLNDSDKVNIYYNYNIADISKISAGSVIGCADIYINETLLCSVNILSDTCCNKADLAYYIKYCLKTFLLK